MNEEVEKERKLTGAEKTKAALDKADRLIKDEKERMLASKKEWELCSRCHVNKVAPWNKKGVCSPCQHPTKSKGDGTSFLDE